jgi:hypothetical protein
LRRLTPAQLQGHCQVNINNNLFNQNNFFYFFFKNLLKTSAISLIDARLCGQFALPHGIFVPDVREL